MEFKPGDMFRHKATKKIGVVIGPWSDGNLEVRTQDNKREIYSPAELEPWDEGGSVGAVGGEEE